MHSPDREVHSARGIKRLQLTAPKHGKNISLVIWGSTLSQAIPPKISEGKRCPAEWSHNIPPGSAIEMTVKWSTTCHVLAKWVSHYVEFRTAGKISLYLMVTNLIWFQHCRRSGRQHNIALLACQLHTGVAVGVRSFWGLLGPGRMEILEPRRKERFENNVLEDLIWCLDEIQDTNHTSCLILGGIRFYPFNDDVIPDSAFALSVLTFLQSFEEEGHSIEPDGGSNSEICNF